MSKSYIHEIKLPQELMQERNNSALTWGEEQEVHRKHVLREGHKRLAAVKESYRALEETE